LRGSGNIQAVFGCISQFDGYRWHKNLL